MGIEAFKTKASLERYIKGLLKDSEPGTILQGRDKEIILELINRHPKVAEKIGPGVHNIVVRLDPVWKKSKQFLIIHKGGGSIDFSYKKCLYGEKSKLDLFRDACRTAVAPDIIRFKKENLRPDSVCPYLGIPLDQDNAVVDHVKPATFNVLVDEFMFSYAIEIENVLIEGELQRRFSNPGTSAQFRHFHNIAAVLELVSELANNTVCKSPQEEPHGSRGN